MIKWKLEKINKNLYKLTLDDNYVEFTISHDFSSDVAINLYNKNMSEDKVIFFNDAYETPQNQSVAIIGRAYLYNENGICVEESLVDATPINTNCDFPKEIIEGYFL
jgi:hypothetical protein